MNLPWRGTIRPSSVTILKSRYPFLIIVRVRRFKPYSTMQIFTEVGPAVPELLHSQQKSIRCKVHPHGINQVERYYYCKNFLCVSINQSLINQSTNQSINDTSIVPVSFAQHNMLISRRKSWSSDSPVTRKRVSN